MPEFLIFCTTRCDWMSTYTNKIFIAEKKCGRSDSGHLLRKGVAVPVERKEENLCSFEGSGGLTQTFWNVNNLSRER